MKISFNIVRIVLPFLFKPLQVTNTLTVVAEIQPSICSLNIRHLTSGQSIKISTEKTCLHLFIVWSMQSVKDHKRVFYSQKNVVVRNVTDLFCILDHN